LWFKRLNKAATANDRKWHICDAQRMAPMSEKQTFLISRDMIEKN
jgi:hypothetical protein